MLIRDVRIEFEDAPSFLQEYEQSLRSGWIFVASEADFELGEALEVTLDLDFCSRSVRVLGVVTSRIAPELAKMLGRAAGAVVEFADGIAALDEMLHDTIAGLGDERRAGGPLPLVRQPSSMIARRIERSGPALETRTRNLSRGDALLELSGVDLRLGETVALHLVDPRSGDVIAVSARVLQAGPDTGQAAKPPKHPAAPSPLEPPGGGRLAIMERMRDMTESRRMGGISGNLSGLSLPSLLQSIATSSTRGTMDIVCDGLEAHLLFESNRLRYAGLGRIEGIKALARLLEWPAGEFSFQPNIDEGEPDRPLVSIDSAIMEAAHQADELRRIKDDLLPDTVVVERTEAGRAIQLSRTQASVLDQLARPACPTALLDALPDPDAQIWRALLDLVQRGFVRIRAQQSER